MRTFTIHHKRDLASCLYYLAEQSEPDWPLVVTCQPEDHSRSTAQNRLLWLRHTEIGKHLGYTPDEIHAMAKERLVVPVMIRDSEGYAAMVQAVKQVRAAGMVTEADALRAEIIRLTSTTRLSVKQMAEVLEGQERWAAEVGAEITFPDDLIERALGRTKKKQED